MTPNTLRGRLDVDIDGKSVPVLLNMNSLRLLTENEKIALADFDKEIQKNPLSFIPRLLYWGAVNMATRAGKTAKAVPTFEIFAAHICEDDEQFAELAEKVAEVFTGGKAEKSGK
tara:strand:+ start:125 stop:469 length:345 start_codon:yes stop_codon:yes gene_type:complete